MKNRALRYAVAALLVGACLGAAYLIWAEESKATASVDAARRFDAGVQATSRTLLEIRSAQAGYVAAGQGEDYWTTKVDALLARVREGFAQLRDHVTTAEAATEIDTAEAAVEDFEQMDRRARGYARGGQRLLASDLVYSDGIEKTDAALAALARARDFETAAGEASHLTARRTQLLTIGGAAVLGLLVLVVLVPLPRDARPERSPITAAQNEPAVDAPNDDRGPAGAPPARPAPEAPASAAPPVVAGSPPVPSTDLPDRGAAGHRQPGSSMLDLAGLASVCSELARVVDPRGLPSALERAARLLHASGIVIWVTDPDGRELIPVAAHGYAPDLLNRLGAIDRDAENVTAAAFRTGLIQTVRSEPGSPGAIAAPLLTASGPVGVMAAEMLDERERHEQTLSATAIVAAQLATLIAPPTRPAGKAEPVRA